MCKSVVLWLGNGKDMVLQLKNAKDVVLQLGFCNKKFCNYNIYDQIIINK